MEFKFLYSLGEIQSRYVAFYHEQKWSAIEQHPLWFETIEPSKKTCFFIAEDESRITCCAVIEEHRKLYTNYANIQFGPLFSNPDILVACVDKICSYYQKKGFGFLTIQLGIETGAGADYIEYGIAKARKYTCFHNRENWSSLRINLLQEEQEILRSFSKGHKADVKRAHKNGLTVIEDFSDETFSSFIAIYSSMHRARGLKEHADGSAAYLTRVREFLLKHKAGKFLLVLDGNVKVVGGIAILYQNKTVRYFKGAADPESRNLPILHLAIATAIVNSKAEGYDYFDLWGYNHFVGEDDQIFFINRFKKGFGGTYLFYPKKMYFVFNSFKFTALTTIQRIYKKHFRKI